jgi:predicted RNA binding protein YcfA (HicA-like mRNA interferase family)
LPKLRKVSGKTAIKVLCNKFGFEISGRSGSHVRLSKITPEGSANIFNMPTVKNKVLISAVKRIVAFFD